MAYSGKFKVGDKIYSKYFGAEIVITQIKSNKKWMFRLPDGRELHALTPLSYFEEVNKESS